MDIIERFNKEHPDKEILLLVIAGSHFFNLQSPTSDQDYRGIFITKSGKDPCSEISFNTNNKTKNSKDDIDCTFYSLKKFLTLLGNGDFNMIELLYAPEDKILVNSDTYKELRYIRSAIVSNDISSFLGFIKGEYKKFGMDKNHYGIISNFVAFLKAHRVSYFYTLKDIWTEILEYADEPENFIKISQTRNDNKVLPAIVIAKRMFQYTAKIDYVLDQLNSMLEKYGHRRVEMAENKVEVKGLYHTMRLLIEAKEFITTGELTFPFPDSDYNKLRSIKDNKIEDIDGLFSEIDQKIQVLMELEKKTISNKKNVQILIDKLIDTYYSRLRIQNLVKGSI
jgi:predicted nucleotidyltransferase